MEKPSGSASGRDILRQVSSVKPTTTGSARRYLLAVCLQIILIFQIVSLGQSVYQNFDASAEISEPEENADDATGEISDSEEGGGETAPHMEPVPSSFEMKFAVISDTHIKSPIQTNVEAYLNKVLPDIKEQGVNFAVITGDLMDTTVGYFPKQIGLVHSHITNNTEIPVFYTYGSHGKEWGIHYTAGRIPQSVFSGDFQGWYYEQSFPYMWSMTLDNIHFVFLPAAFGDDIFLGWLEKDLAENKDYTTIIFGHYPVYEFDEQVRSKFKSILSENPQVIGVISGHIYQGHHPIHIAGNAYQFIAWAGMGKKESVYIAANQYLVFKLTGSGLEVFERDTDDDVTWPFYNLRTPTTLAPRDKIKVSLPYLMRDGQTVSLPTPELRNARLGVWGVNTTQIVDSPTAPWTVDSSEINYEGNVDASNGNEALLLRRYAIDANCVEKELEAFFECVGNKFLAQQEEGSGRWAHLDIFKEKDLRNETRLNYGIFVDIRSTPSILVNRQLELINATSGDVVASTTNDYGTGSKIFFNFALNVGKDNMASGTVAGGEFGDLPVSGLNSMTLRLSLAPGENPAEIKNIHVGVWVQNREFVLAPLAGSGNFMSESLNVTLGRSTYAFGELNHLEHKELSLGTIGGDVSLTVNGSRTAVVELTGEAEPVLFAANPRDALVTDDSIQINEQLFSRSKTLANTVLYALKPVMIDGELQYVAKIAEPTRVKLADIPDVAPSPPIEQPETVYSLSLTKPALTNNVGDSLASADVNDPLGIRAKVANASPNKLMISYIVQVKDSEGITVFLSSAKNLSLWPNQSIDPIVFWTPSQRGNYSADVFVWKSGTGPVPLSSPVSMPIKVL